MMNATKTVLPAPAEMPCSSCGRPTAGFDGAGHPLCLGCFTDRVTDVLLEPTEGEDAP